MGKRRGKLNLNLERRIAANFSSAVATIRKGCQVLENLLTNPWSGSRVAGQEAKPPVVNTLRKIPLEHIMDRTEFLELARKAFDKWMDEVYALAAADKSDDYAIAIIGSCVERFKGEDLERVRQSLFEEFKRAKEARKG